LFLDHFIKVVLVSIEEQYLGTISGDGILLDLWGVDWHYDTRLDAKKLTGERHSLAVVAS